MYKTSKDYKRLWELVSTRRYSGIIGRWLNRGDRLLHTADVTPIYDKQQTIECWENGGFEYIDPADYCDKQTISTEISHIQAVLDESDGVAGWHKNGALARWCETGIPDALELIRVQLQYYVWQKVWHSPEELPEDVTPRNKVIYVDELGGACTINWSISSAEWKTFGQNMGIVRWAYVRDLETIE